MTLYTLALLFVLCTCALALPRVKGKLKANNLFKLDLILINLEKNINIVTNLVFTLKTYNKYLKIYNLQIKKKKKNLLNKILKITYYFDAVHF
jgi:hypothetical protein